MNATQQVSVISILNCAQSAGQLPDFLIFLYAVASFRSAPAPRRTIIRAVDLGLGHFPMALVLFKRTALFFAIVLSFAFLAAAARAASHDVVPFAGYSTGTIVIKTCERRLYYVLDGSRALRFPVGVGRTGMQWNGTAHIEGKYVRPAWAPPEVIRRDKPYLPALIPGGAPNN